MKLCVHPDDQPVEYLKGTFRPQTSVEGMRRLVNLVDSLAMPDHTPRLEAKDWWETGMAFALGYIRGAMQAIDGEPIKS